VYGGSDAAISRRVDAVIGGSAVAGASTLVPFLTALASGEPTPGGGAASAAMGAVGASLAAMACRLTEGKAEFDGRRARFKEIEVKAIALQTKLITAVDEDVAAYNAVIEALRRPKEDPKEKAARAAALQSAFKWATNVPLAVADACADTLELLAELASIGLASAISDVGVGARAARAGFDGASFNVLINLGSIKDTDFVVNARGRLDAARVRAQAAAAAADEKVRAGLA
jgi:formiminotetrahydrofolate cyclodeaminase